MKDMILKFYPKEFSSLSSTSPANFDVPFYANTSPTHYYKYPCPSQLFSSKASRFITNFGTHSYKSLERSDGIIHSTDSSSIQSNDYMNVTDTQTKSIFIGPEHTCDEITSMTHLSNTEFQMNSKSLESNKTYENIKSYSKMSPLTVSFKPNPLLRNRKSSTDHTNSSLSPSSPIYLNLQDQLSKRSNEKKKERKIIYLPLNSIDEQRFDIDQKSNTNTIQIVKRLGVNLAPTCRDKSILYRTKMPTTITSIPTSFYQQRTLNALKNYNQRDINVQAFEEVQNAKSMKPHASDYNVAVHHPIMAQHQWQRTMRKNRLMRSVENQLYNEVQEPKFNDRLSQSICFENKAFQYSKDFRRVLHDQVFAQYPTETTKEEEFAVKTSSDSGSETSDEKDESTDDEELCRHDTFEDFFLRRPLKSSCSTPRNGVNNAASETMSQDAPTHSSMLNLRSPSIALGLDKTDVDFIHNIIERSHGSHRVSNRITALREAYVRSLNKKQDMMKATKQLPIDDKKKKPPMTLTQAYVSSKVRDELEKYDELPPVPKKSAFNDEDVYSVYYQENRLCSIPTLISTAGRIYNFFTTLKRQIHKNFQDIRTRILIEAMNNPSNRASRHSRRTVRNSSRQSHRPSTRRHITHHANSRQPMEQSNHVHRHHLQRIHTNKSRVNTQQIRQCSPTNVCSPQRGRTPHVHSRQKRT